MALMPAYCEALRREIAASHERWGRAPISTIYVGGGTPSLLPLDGMAGIIAAVHATFDLSQCIETSVEVNPGTVDRPYLDGLRSLGFDRLSIGAQSAHEEELQMLGRIHSWPDVVRALEGARGAGFENCSLDLLFGLPRQSLERWRQTLERALELEPEHLSLYGLSVEEDTPLARQIAAGDLVAPDDDRAATMYELAEETLAAVGYFHYEISSWARVHPSSEWAGSRWWPISDPLACMPEVSEGLSPYVCSHNLTYWRNEPWLGVGAGAWSWMTRAGLGGGASWSEPGSGGARWTNVDHPRDYVDGQAADAPLASRSREVEEIDRQMEMGETMMLGLRLAEGVGAERFEARFGVRMVDVFGEELSGLQKVGLLGWDGAVARLTERGRLLGNRVFERFV